MNKIYIYLILAFISFSSVLYSDNIYTENINKIKVNYYSLNKNEEIKGLITKFINSIKNNQDEFSDLLGDTISVRLPIYSMTEDDFKKTQFMKEFTNDYKSFHSIGFYYGLLYDDKFSLENFKVNSFKNSSFIVSIFPSSYYDYGFTIHRENIDLTMLTFLVKNNQIVALGSEFRYPLDLEYRGEYPFYFVWVKKSKVYKTEEMKEVIGEVERNEKINVLKELKVFKKMKNELMSGEDDSFISYVEVPKLKIKGYIFEKDYIPVCSILEPISNPNFDAKRGDNFYSPTVNNLLLRDKPSTSGKIVKRLSKDEVLRYIEWYYEEETINNIKGRWMRIKSEKDDIMGWCFGGYLKKIEYDPGEPDY